MLASDNDFDPEQSLWSFWRATKRELILDDKEAKKRFEKMKHRDIVMENGYIYLKWENRGIWTSINFDEELRLAEIDAIDSWDYPKSNKIANNTVNEIKSLINTYCAGLGYTAKYISYE